MRDHIARLLAKQGKLEAAEAEFREVFNGQLKTLTQIIQSDWMPGTGSRLRWPSRENTPKPKRNSASFLRHGDGYWDPIIPKR